MTANELEPERRTARTILETIVEMVDAEEVFEWWGELESAIVDILKESTK